MQAVATPDSDAFLPRYGLQTTIGQGNEKFDNATATLLFVVRSDFQAVLSVTCSDLAWTNPALLFTPPDPHRVPMGACSESGRVCLPPCLHRPSDSGPAAVKVGLIALTVILSDGVTQPHQSLSRSLAHHVVILPLTMALSPAPLLAPHPHRNIRDYVLNQASVGRKRA